MQQTEIPVPIVKFGVFEVDLRAGELTRLGKRVRLQEQPFQLLAMLLAKPGVLVTREELHLKLWPETTVDFDHGLNKAVSKIREALGDSAENPRFIETVARRGYKFLADVTVVGDEQPAPETVDLAPQQNAEPLDVPSRHRITCRHIRRCTLPPHRLRPHHLGGRTVFSPSGFSAGCLYLSFCC